MSHNQLTDADRFLKREQVASLSPITSKDLKDIFICHKPGLSPEASKGYVSSFSSESPKSEGFTLRHYFTRMGLDKIYPLDEMVCFGRLDRDASGLLVISKKNKYPKFIDQLLLNPYFKQEGSKISKVYRAKVKGAVDESALQKIQVIKIPSFNNEFVEVSLESIRVISINRTTPFRFYSVIEIEINEGKHHQVKKMCYAFGHPVHKGGLHRSGFGNLTLATSEADHTEIQKGIVRPLFVSEKKWLIETYNKWIIHSKQRLQDLPSSL